MRVLAGNILLAIVFAASSSAASPPDEMREFMQELAKEGLGPGSVVLITVNGETVVHEAAGMTSLDGDTPMALNAIFNIHSMTKPITSVALMQCVEDGLVSLDDPVAKYIPAYADIDSARPITIRDLLTHTSGIGYGRGHDEVIAKSANLTEYVDHVATIPLIHEPGERFTYGVGPAIAGRVVEIVRKEDLRSAVRTRILEPLGMNDTGWELSDPDRLVSRAIKVPSSRQAEFGNRTTVDETERLDLEPKWITPWEAARARGVTYGDGGMFSTADDYTRFARMIVNRGELDGARILAPATVDLMLQDHLPESIRYGENRGKRFGLGFEVQVDPETGKAIPGEHGWGGAASTYYFGDSAKHATAVYMNALMPFDSASKARFTELAQLVIAEHLQPPIVASSGGLLEGSWENNGRIAAFKGIPYAAPPIGELRWKPPQPFPPWTSVRPAKEFGAMCPQPPGMRSFANRMLARIGGKGTVPEFPPMSEDCLTLNVWTPNLEGQELAPVLVWIHGGGHRMGSGAFDGSPICDYGVVSVSFNMRLGVFGFFSHPSLSAESPTGTSGNQGLQDVIAVLEWVHENIAKFGGNPDRVILGGLSAGAGSAAILLAAPAADGLFHGVFSVSPAPIALRHGLEPGVQGQYSAHAYGQMLAGGLGLDPEATVEELRAISAEQLVTAGLGLEAVVIHLDGPFTPKVDGHVIPEPVFDRFASGKVPDVPLIIGAGSDEATFVSDWLLERMNGGDFEKHVSRLLGPEGAKIASRYPRPNAGPVTSAMGQFTGDWFFVANSRATADVWSRAGRPAWLYHTIAAFPEGTPGAHMGAFHGYAFDNGALNSVEWDPEGVFDQLTERMSLRLAEFARSGDPNVEGLPQWELYDREGDAYLLLEREEDIPSRGLRPEELNPLQKAIQERGH